MKLSSLTEAKYHKGASPKDKENLIWMLSDMLPIKEVDHDGPNEVKLEIDHDTIENYGDYQDIVTDMTRRFGRPKWVDGYSGGIFKKDIFPQWTHKGLKITFRSGYGDYYFSIMSR